MGQEFLNTKTDKNRQEQGNYEPRNYFEIEPGRGQDRRRTLQPEACIDCFWTSDFQCITSEAEDGCVTIMLVSFGGNLIDVGTGHLFSLNYDVADDAPSMECINLTPGETKASDENNNQVDATAEVGEFCIN